MSSWCGGGVECGGGADMVFCYVVVVVLWCVLCCVLFGWCLFCGFFCRLLYESPGGNKVDGLPPVLHWGAQIGDFGHRKVEIDIPGNLPWGD